MSLAISEICDTQENKGHRDVALAFLKGAGADTGFRKVGGGVQVTVNYLNAAFSGAHARRFFSLDEVWGSPKRGGGADPQDPPPWIRPCR